MTEDASKLARRSEITKEMKMDEWVQQSFENYRLIKSNLKSGRFGLLESEYKKHKGPCFVLGSGPSLDLAYDDMKRLGYPIICGGTQIPTLTVHGIGPRWLLLYDTHPHNWRFIRPDKIDYPLTTLITYPSCPPRILEQWKGPVALYRLGVAYHKSTIESATMTIGEFLERYKPNPEDHMSYFMRDEHGIFFKSIIGRAYPEIKVLILSTSCTPNHACIIADFLGYDPIYLVGVDNGYTYGKKRAQIYLWSNGEFTPRDTPDAPKDAILSENGVPTDEQMIAYKIALVHISRTVDAQIYEVGDPRNPGINNYFPTVSWPGVSRKNLPVWTREEKTKRVAEYLLAHGSTIVPPEIARQVRG